ncbi:hypothetical protein [Flavobacterium sp. TAB 87]|uniref:hypothetical protein n=1 Tax=Flavobacterium sp. TAB 87 TaxID=1729581 RepID=UPI00076D12EB|nr:hypothetical protein [Flavobacterium sp. TAB 87]KVV16119.1 hypothetical protein AP058_00284 [Flavobacterium sp. TAB 87]
MKLEIRKEDYFKRFENELQNIIEEKLKEILEERYLKNALIILNILKPEDSIGYLDDTVLVYGYDLRIHVNFTEDSSLKLITQKITTFMNRVNKR